MGLIKIDRLMTVFAKALSALIPHLREAKIPWRAPQAYNSWDSVSEGMFEAFVTSYFEDVLADAMPMLGYGFEPDEYDRHRYLACLCDHYPDALPFIGLDAEHDEFDAVNMDVSAFGLANLTLPLSDVTFVLVKTKDGTRELIDAVEDDDDGAAPIKRRGA